MGPKRRNPDKAKRLEEKGDSLLEKGKLKKALKKYRKALDYDPTRKSIYDKLMHTKDLSPDDWNVDDFVESVEWAMQKQEQENPPIKQVHAMLTPEWEKAKELAVKVISSESREEQDSLIEELVDMGEMGVRAAVGLLIDFKKAASGEEGGEPSDTQ